MRNINIPLNDILDIVVCSSDYGFDNDVLITFFAEYIGELTFQEIEDFAGWFKSEEGLKSGYGIEDYEEIKYRLLKFKKRCNL